MRIVKLEAENFKRLKAVTIEPDSTMQVVAGRNAQGKTSVLDAIWWVLEQRGAKIERVVRDGEKAATVRLTFDDLIVTRTTSGAGAGKLTVTSRDGATYNSPQTMLDKLVGKLSLDPLAFANAEPKKQVEILLGLVDLGFDPEEVARSRQTFFDLRTQVGREVKKARGLVDSLPEAPADTPDQQVSAADLMADIRAAEEVEREFAAVGERYGVVKAEIERLQAEFAELTARGFELAAKRNPQLPYLQKQLGEVDEINARVAVKLQREHAQTEYERVADEYQELTQKIVDIDEYKQTALAAAAMPVPGLGLDDDGVTYNGVPLSQASGAERLRVSTGIAMALNPEVRVIRITDGSLMDNDSMNLLYQMATERDFQVWVERVGTGDAMGVVIEDGEVVA